MRAFPGIVFLPEEVIKNSTRRNEEAIHHTIESRFNIFIYDEMTGAADDYRSTFAHVLYVLLNHQFQFAPCIVALAYTLEQPEMCSIKFSAFRAAESSTLGHLSYLVQDSEYPNSILGVA
jgi:hypothetical protein